MYFSHSEWAAKVLPPRYFVLPTSRGGNAVYGSVTLGAILGCGEARAVALVLGPEEMSWEIHLAVSLSESYTSLSLW